MKTCEIQTITRSAEKTAALGFAMGTRLSSSMIIALTGDLGSGKTAFVQGLARGVGVPESYYVTSPSFTLVNEYPGRIPLIHVDLYRIEEHTAIADLGLDDLLGSGVAAIEWAERMGQDLPGEYISVKLEILNDTTRKILLKGYGLPASNVLHSLEIEISAQAQSMD
ncbi:MAG: tRNA (adenosine(37)-N6)-threonylcarbamoyltransferase complex ATPase subunit type 1 TsaE [Deltaproteobacteria bacterium]|nr:tRNA (adenosine(37)-N6)-threonylcarbamoyltransferase complex ATPase subunit type 1 TsaE [Deltaproteobacteria bacterium]